ncbi:S26 family signal peptidase [Streptomyces sp. NPDC096176]|uniref:S26 family signal peptidase n=1 Tax=Streptomyces sp. NPDC096176 TaxID=3366079 RepID=UPI00381A3C8E
MREPSTPPAAHLRGPRTRTAPTARARPATRATRSLALIVLGSAGPVLLLAGRLPWGLLCCAAAVLLTLGAALGSLLGRRLVAVTVRGDSMQPAYQDEDRVLVRRDRKPTRGQVVVVERPAGVAGWSEPPVATTAPGPSLARRQWLIKRVAAVPGDPVPRDRVPVLAGSPAERVPEGSLVLLGDNQQASFDSRHVGYFPAERVLGAVVRSLPPYEATASGPLTRRRRLPSDGTRRGTCRTEP